MVRKIIIIIISALLLFSCDYKPIYSDNSNIDFSIEKINFKGDSEINNLINRKLKKYKKTNSVRKFNVDVNSVYKKIAQSKDQTGKTTDYKIIIEVTFEINDNKKITTLMSQEDFLIKNLTNEFEENKYEKIKIQNSVDIIINTFTIQLSKI